MSSRTKSSLQIGQSAVGSDDKEEENENVTGIEVSNRERTKVLVGDESAGKCINVSLGNRGRRRFAGRGRFLRLANAKIKGQSVVLLFLLH